MSLSSPATQAATQVPVPVTVLRSEAEAIAAAREAATQIAQIAADPAQQRRVPQRQADIVSNAGLFSIAVPKALGGLGASVRTLVEVIRLISSADGGVGQLLQIHNVMLRGVMARPAGAQRERLLADLLAGKRLGHAGAEVGGKHKFDTKTRATRNAQGQWVINGSKFYATGCYLAEWISSGAVSDEGPIGFLVHRDTPGLILEDDWDAFGQQHSVSGTVRFDNLVLDPQWVSTRNPQPATEAVPIRTGLTWPQILHAAIDTGIARGALEAATHYLRNHARPWVDAEVERAVDEQHVIKRIGEYAVEVRSAEALLAYAAKTFDRYKAGAADDNALQDELILAVATARAQSDHASVFIGSDLFSLLGASSTLTKWNLDRFWGDARVHTTHDPIRWRLHHVGNYYLNGVAPDEYGALQRSKRARDSSVLT